MNANFDLSNIVYFPPLYEHWAEEINVNVSGIANYDSSFAQGISIV